MSYKAKNDEAVEAVGLPNRKRYNWFVYEAVNQTKIGGHNGKAQVFATLALAEATLLSGENN